MLQDEIIVLPYFILASIQTPSQSSPAPVALYPLALPNLAGHVILLNNQSNFFIKLNSGSQPPQEGLALLLFSPVDIENFTMPTEWSQLLLT